MTQEAVPVGERIGDRAYLIAVNDGDDFASLLDVALERIRQRQLGYTAAHDDEHSIRDFTRFIGDRVMELAFADLADVTGIQKLFVQVAALGVAAASSVRRQYVQGGLF